MKLTRNDDLREKLASRYNELAATKQTPLDKSIPRILTEEFSDQLSGRSYNSKYQMVMYYIRKARGLKKAIHHKTFGKATLDQLSLATPDEISDFSIRRGVNIKTLRSAISRHKLKYQCASLGESEIMLLQNYFNFNSEAECKHYNVPRSSILSTMDTLKTHFSLTLRAPNFLYHPHSFKVYPMTATEQIALLQNPVQFLRDNASKIKESWKQLDRPLEIALDESLEDSSVRVSKDGSVPYERPVKIKKNPNMKDSDLVSSRGFRFLETQPSNVKYESSGNVQLFKLSPTENVTIHQIRNCETKELGGYIEHMGNLSDTGSCWIERGCVVVGDSRVSGEAQVKGKAIVIDSDVSDYAVVKTNVTVNQCMIKNNATVGGMAQLHNVEVSGNAHVQGNVVLDGREHPITITGKAYLAGYYRLVATEPTTISKGRKK